MADATVKRERTCIGCGVKAQKTCLYRLVRCEDRSVRFDSTGNRAGRGAYVCSSECLEKAIKAGKVQRALRVPLGREDADRAASEIEAAIAAQTI